MRTGSLGKRSPPPAGGQVLVGPRGQGWASSCHPKGPPPCPLSRPFAEPAAAGIHVLATGNEWKRRCLPPAHSRQRAQEEAGWGRAQRPPKTSGDTQVAGRTLRSHRTPGPTPVCSGSGDFRQETEPEGVQPTPHAMSSPPRRGPPHSAGAIPLPGGSPKWVTLETVISELILSPVSSKVSRGALCFFSLLSGWCSI